MQKLSLPYVAHSNHVNTTTLASPDPFGDLDKIHEQTEESAVTEEVVRHNMHEVMRCSLSIDALMATFISKFFEPKIETRRTLFDDWIVHSSAVTYKTKFDILVAAVKSEQKLSEKIDLKKIDEHFMRVMMFRNAFAHGKLMRDEPGGSFTIHHFRGQPEQHDLDEKRFKKLENSCRAVFDNVRALIESL